MADNAIAGAVTDDETLYRAIRPEYARDADGSLHLSVLAFADRQMRPSVDRAFLKGFVPAATRFSESDGVIRVIAAEIRAIRATRRDAKGNALQEYAADVEPVPLPENAAHAEIYGRPGFDNAKVFRRICESLALVAVWEVLPAKEP